MPLPPNQSYPNFELFQDAPSGTFTVGQYHYNWLLALGGTLALLPGNVGYEVVMPMLNGSPAPIPDALNAGLVAYRESVLAAAQGIAYPPLPTGTCA
jgi:hypothetical protein